jgi:hypothetical protein
MPSTKDGERMTGAIEIGGHMRLWLFTGLILLVLGLFKLTEPKHEPERQNSGLRRLYPILIDHQDHDRN